MLTLSITGFDADPDRVTELLGISPSEVVRVGQPRTSGRISKFNGWWLELHADQLTEGLRHEGAINKLVEHLEGRDHLFSELRNKLKPESVTIYGAFYVSDEQQGIWLEPAQMAVLAACGVGWGLDLCQADTQEETSC